uniref:Transcription factor n=1 Tax=Arundo donax TaxID=35708 RepID=A0A0A9HBA3_ARUDO
MAEQWLGHDDGLDKLWDGGAWGDTGSRSAGNDLSDEPPAPAAKRRSRQPGPRTASPAINHVEAERQRRDKLNRRFCDLRAVVPKVSRMDKASLLADATSYIAELRGRVKKLEAEAKETAARNAAAPSGAATIAAASHSFGPEEKLEVRVVGPDAAALRLTTAARHAPALLMHALRSLDLPVQHACVCRVGGVTVQDAVVGVPATLRDEACLRAVLLHSLQRGAA